MLFAHDTEAALAAAAALVNTGRNSGEGLPDVAALDRFEEDWRRTERPVNDRQELYAVRRLRQRLAGLWEIGADEAAALVNALFKESSALPQLVRHGRWDYHLHSCQPEAPLVDRLAAEAAMAFADVIQSGQFDRLRVCAAADCDDVLVDLSKNRSRRFCSITCANRMNMASYRKRHGQAPCIKQ
jgi:predicted RNA-binding Zn ribbon-like protein